MQDRAGAWSLSGLASIIMLSIVMGTPAFGQYSLTSSGPITIGDEPVIGTPGKASPYGSTISVPGPVPAGSTLEKVTVTLYGLSHGYANDIVAVLVGPNGNAVTLIGNAGNGQPITNAVITFDDAGSAPPTQTTTLTSGTFKATNNTPDDDGKSYGAASGTPLPSPAPQGLPYFSTFAAAFGGLGANYTNNWTLYIIDTSQPNTGSISNWVLNLYTTPILTGVQSNATVTFPENTTATLFFTNTDVTSNATLTGVISALVNSPGNPVPGNFLLFTNPATTAGDFIFANLSPNGTGTITLKPSPNMYGTATFNLALSDGKSSSATVPFTVTVTHVPQAPKLTVPASITTFNEVGSASNNMTLVSVDGNGAGALALSVFNPALGNTQIGATVFTNINGQAGTLNVANTNSFQFGLVPNAFPVAGTNVVDFVLTDTSAALSVTQAVTVIVQSLGVGGAVGPLVFTNTNSIVFGNGSVNPVVMQSSITVPSLAGIGSNGVVSVSLIGLSNAVPANFSAALISPAGTVLPLLFQPAGVNPVIDAEITFFDGNGQLPFAPSNTANTLPTAAANGITITNYVVKSFGSTLGQGLNSIVGTQNTNVWTLKVTNSSVQSGQIAGGWALDLYPAPLVTFTNPTLTSLESTPGHIVSTNNQVIVSSILEIATNLIVSVPVGLNDGNAVVAVTNVVGISTNVGGTNFTTFNVTFNNTTNEFSPNNTPYVVSATSKDTNGLLGTGTLPYTINFVDQPPTISFIPEQVAFAGTPILNVPFVVSSPDTNAARLNINVSSLNQALLPTSAFQNNAVVSRGPSTGQFGTLAGGDPPFQPLINGTSAPSFQTNYLSLYPVGVKGGQSQITVEVDDGANGTTNTETFLLFVQGPGSPTYYNSAPINIPSLNSVGSPYPSTNVVSGLVGKVENVVVTVFDVNEVQNASGLTLLLVGPTAGPGTNPAVFLMGGAGGPAGTVGLTNANLVFSNAINGTIGSSVVLPQVGQIPSTNIYYPTNYNNNAYTSQASGGLPAASGTPAPNANGSTGYSTNLSDYNSINPNGTWSLYAYDTNGNRGGAIFGGWQLSIYTAPNITAATNNYSTLENVPTNILIPVGDAEPANTALTVSTVVTPAGASSATTITIASGGSVPITNNGVANLAILAITPNPYQFGTNNIMITATDASGVQSITNILFTVISNSQPPLIFITNTTPSTPAALPISGITFAVWDAQTTNQNTIVASANPSGLIQSITVTSNAIDNVHAPGTNVYSLSIQPAGVQTGVATITISVIDGVGQTSKTNITLTITPNTAFASTGSLSLGPGYPETGEGSPYPWAIPVFGVGGLVSEVSVNLNGFSHNLESNVDLLLVSPDGQHGVVLMAGAGGNLSAGNLNLQFSDAAAAPIPQNAQLTSIAYQPSNYVSGLVFSNPPPSSGAPNPPSGASVQEVLSNAFNGVNPNGKWYIYAMDTGFPDNGSIASAILFISTKPAITAIPAQGIAENGQLIIPLTIGDSSVSPTNLTVTASDNDNDVIVTVQSNLTAGATNLLITLVSNWPSLTAAMTLSSTNATNKVTVTVSDGNNADTVMTQFSLTVTNINQAPVISSASTTNLQIAENGSNSLTFMISDVDSYLAAKGVTITSTNPALVVNGYDGIITNVPLVGSLTPGNTATITYEIKAVANVFGTNIGGLVFSVADTNGNVTTTNVTLAISHTIQAPKLTIFGGTSNAFPGGSISVSFTNTTFESNATLTVSASSAAPGSIPNSPANIVITPSSSSNAAPGSSTGTIQLIVPSTATPSPVGVPDVITVTLTQVVAGATQTVSQTFNVAVLTTPVITSVNAAPIANVATNPVALPYPSTITLGPGLIGGVYRASVTLNGFNASNPSDVSMVLQSPSGPSVLLLAAAGGTNPVSNLTLTFADTNSLAPQNTALGPNGSSVAYHPTSYVGQNNALPTNAPVPPYLDRMAAFNGVNPNGTWKLFVVDNTTGQTVGISNGWSLTLSTAPLLSFDTPAATNNFTIAENAPGGINQGQLSFNIQDSTGGAPGDVISVTSVPSPLFSSITIVTNSTTIVAGEPEVDYTATLVPAVLSTGSGTLSFSVTRTTDGASEIVSFPVTIVKSNQPPVFTRLGPITANENQTAQSEFFVTELGDPLSDVSVAAYSSNPALIQNSNITFTTGFTTPSPGTLFKTNIVNLASFAGSVANAGDLILNLTPQSGAVSAVVGTSTITVWATNNDGAFNSPTVTTATFLFTVNAAQFPPQFVGIPQGTVSVIGGSTTNITFQVTSADATPPTITVTATNLTGANGTTIGTITSAPNTTAGSTWTVPINTAPTTVQVKSTIQISATDANNLTTTTNFQFLTIPSQQHFYSNSAPINIVDVSPSIPSPSIIPVSGLVGTVTNIVVTLNGFGHQYPADVGVLLVGPNGSNTVLMNNAGTGFPVSGLSLSFSNNEAVGGVQPAPVPPSQPLTTGTFSPSDYQPVKPYNFELSGPNNTPTYNATNPAPPGGPYPTNLAVLNGSNPNGNWYLYVQDDSAGDVGNITGGWTIQIFTQPQLQITSATNITVPENNPSGKVAFSILEDSAVAAGSYTSNSFSVTSSNTTLIPAANVTFIGSGTNWTANFVAAVNQVGTSLITITSQNIYGQQATAQFLVTVTAVNFPPTIFQPVPGSTITIQAGTATTIALGYSDTGFNTNTLIVTATSVNLDGANPIPNSSLSFSPGAGTGPSNLVVTPVGTVTGSNLITLTVTQPVANNPSSNSIQFTIVVVPSTAPVTANTTPITIGTNSPAFPYPSSVTVSGIGSPLTNISVTLVGFSHTFPADVSALLVGPGGQAVMLMSDEGSGIAVSNLRLTFNDAGGTMAANGPLTSGTYAPAQSDLNFINNQPDVTLPPGTNTPPPAPPYLHTLSSFNGLSGAAVNGTWRLYVYDNAFPDTGTISGGWTLNLQTVGPEITPLPAVTIAENSSATIPFSIGSATLAATNITNVSVSASGVVPAGLISVLTATNVPGTGNSNYILTIIPTTNYPSAVTNINGTATITVSLTDTNGNTSINSFLLTVINTNIPPTVTVPVNATNTPANVGLSIPFTVSDVQTTNVSVTATLTTGTNNAVTTSFGTAVVVTNGGGSYTLVYTPTFTPQGVGVVNANILANDGVSTTTNTIVITVKAGLAPVVTMVSATNMPENGTNLGSLSVPFTVANIGGLNPPFTSGSIVGLSSNTNLVTSVGVTGSGSNYAAILTPNQFKTGNTTITIFTQDSFGIGTAALTLTVTPVEFPPVLGAIKDTNTLANTPVAVTLNVTDVATSITNLHYSANISSTNVIQSVTFSYNGSNEVATITPTPNKAGAAAITIIVGDGVTNVSQTFAISVSAPPAPALGPISAQSTVISTPISITLPVVSTVTPITNLTFNGSSTNANLIKSISFSFNGSNEVATITPVTNITGSATVTISVSDAFSQGNSQSFTLTITPPPAPTITAIPAQTNGANKTLTLTLGVTSPVTPITNLTFSGSSTNTNLIKSIAFSFNGTNELVTITPVTNAVGTATVTLFVNDSFSQTNSQTFTLTLVAPTGPTLGQVAAQSTTENTPLSVTLNVTSPVTPITNLTFSGSSTNANLIKSVTFSFNGTNEVALITPVANATGVGSVSISVNDQFSQTNTVNFGVTISSPTPPTLVAVVANGQLKITFTGTPGVAYRIQSSTDLKTWTTVATLTANAQTGAVEYDTALTGSAGGTFYRAVTP